jgi:hypothetical protein
MADRSGCRSASKHSFWRGINRLALDEHLVLSVHFVNHASGRCGSVVPLQDAKLRRIKKISGDGWFDSIVGLDIGQDRAIEWRPGITELEGIWDLTMLGAERLDVEHRYQALTDGPAVNLVFLDGPIVSRDDGTYSQIQEHVAESEFVGPKNLTELPDSPRNYYPAAGLPADSVLVVRTSSLHDLEARLSDRKVEKPIERRERATLLVIIAAMPPDMHVPFTGTIPLLNPGRVPSRVTLGASNNVGNCCDGSGKRRTQQVHYKA